MPFLSAASVLAPSLRAANTRLPAFEAMAVDFAQAARGLGHVLRAFERGLLEAAESEWHRQGRGRIPGSTRTARLRKKRRKALLAVWVESVDESRP